MSKKKKSSLNNTIEMGLACYGAYKILKSMTKDNKKVRPRKVIENKQEKTPSWFWWLLTFLALAGLAKISEWLQS